MSGQLTTPEAGASRLLDRIGDDDLILSWEAKNPAAAQTGAE
jgi:hypothetical protein